MEAFADAVLGVLQGSVLLRSISTLNSSRNHLNSINDTALLYTSHW